MGKSVLDSPHFQNEEAAFAYIEAALWPNGVVCPHCGGSARIGRLQGKTTRPGLHKCYACQKFFTVRMGTILESSHLSLHLWLQVIHLMGTSKRDVSIPQIHRMLNCSTNTAWFLRNRIKPALDPRSSRAKARPRPQETQDTRSRVGSMAFADARVRKSTLKLASTDAEQHKRFVEIAREAEVSERPKDFDRVFKKVACHHS